MFISLSNVINKLLDWNDLYILEVDLLSQLETNLKAEKGRKNEKKGGKRFCLWKDLNQGPLASKTRALAN